MAERLSQKPKYRAARAAMANARGYLHHQSTVRLARPAIAPYQWLIAIHY